PSRDGARHDLETALIPSLVSVGCSVARTSKVTPLGRRGRSCSGVKIGRWEAHSAASKLTATFLDCIPLWLPNSSSCSFLICIFLSNSVTVVSWVRSSSSAFALHSADSQSPATAGFDRATTTPTFFSSDNRKAATKYALISLFLWDIQFSGISFVGSQTALCS